MNLVLSDTPTLADAEAVIERGLTDPSFQAEAAGLRSARSAMTTDEWGYHCAALGLPPSIVDLLLEMSA